MIDFLNALPGILWPLCVLGAAFFFAMAITPEPSFCSEEKEAFTRACEAICSFRSTLDFERRLAAIEQVASRREVRVPDHQIRSTFTPAVMPQPPEEPKLPDPE